MARKQNRFMSFLNNLNPFRKKNKTAEATLSGYENNTTDMTDAQKMLKGDLVYEDIGELRAQVQQNASPAMPLPNQGATQVQQKGRPPMPLPGKQAQQQKQPRAPMPLPNSTQKSAYANPDELQGQKTTQRAPMPLPHELAKQTTNGETPTELTWDDIKRRLKVAKEGKDTYTTIGEKRFAISNNSKGGQDIYVSASELLTDELYTTVPRKIPEPTAGRKEADKKLKPLLSEEFVIMAFMDPERTLPELAESFMGEEYKQFSNEFKANDHSDRPDLLYIQQFLKERKPELEIARRQYKQELTTQKMRQLHQESLKAPKTPKPDYLDADKLEPTLGDSNPAFPIKKNTPAPPPPNRGYDQEKWQKKNEAINNNLNSENTYSHLLPNEGVNVKGTTIGESGTDGPKDPSQKPRTIIFEGEEYEVPSDPAPPRPLPRQAAKQAKQAANIISGLTSNNTSNLRKASTRQKTTGRREKGSPPPLPPRN